MNRGSGWMHEIHVDVRRKSSSFRSPKRGFFSFSTHFPPSGCRSAIQLRLIAHIRFSVVIFWNPEPNRAVKNEFTSCFAELRTFFWIMEGSGRGSPTEKWVWRSAGLLRVSGLNVRSKNRPSFHFDRVTPPTPLSFASQ